MKFSEEVMRVLINHNTCEDPECDCGDTAGKCGYDTVTNALEGLLGAEEYEALWNALMEDRNT